MSLEDDIRQVGLLFTDRIDRSLVESNTEYAGFNECGLAVELLCELLFEHNVTITPDEFDQLQQLAIKTQIDRSFAESLRTLVRKRTGSS